MQLDSSEWWSEQNNRGSIYVQFLIHTPRLWNF